MTVALAVVFGGYLAVLSAIALRTRLPRPTARFASDADLPTVALVVAARDEEACIERCVAALLAQDYPADKLTVVVADDHSTDDTAALVQRIVAERDGRQPEVRYLRVPDPTDHVRGKALALHTAFEAVESDVVLITDADCAPVSSWARTMAHVFADDGVGIACGFARVDERRGRFFDRVQALDWSLLLTAVSAAAEAGMPATGMGNDMGVRRAAYLAVGGYPALPFSVTEDFTLVRAIADRTDWHVRFRPDAGSVVWTLPADGVAATYRQRRRWARGGLGNDPWILPLYGLLWLVHALLVVGLVVAPVAGLAAFAAKALGDGLALSAAARHVGGRVRLLPLLATVAFVTGYFVTLPFSMALQPRIGWKGRHH